MKKLLVCVMTLCLMLSICACSGSKTEGAPAKTTEAAADPQTQQATEEEKKPSGGEVTLEAVLSCPVTPGEEFEYNELADGTVSIHKYIGTDEIIAVPDSIDGMPVTEIGSYAFGVNSMVRGVRLPDSVKLMNTNAFGANERVEVIVTGSGLETIREAGMMGCTRLHTVVLNEGLLEIQLGTFSNCPSLMSLELPASVTTIDPYMIMGRGEDFVLIGGENAEQYAAGAGVGYQAK